MKREYVVKKVDEECVHDENMWQDIPEIIIDCHLWPQNDYRPHTIVKMCYTDYGFYLQFRAFENQIRALYRNVNEPVYKDSCVEFFFNPEPQKSSRYINLEVNPLGAMLGGIGHNRNDRESIPDKLLGQFNIKHSVTFDNLKNYKGPYWSVEYCIPVDFITVYFNNFKPEHGAKLNANFYKCGDDTALPHYACWNKVESFTPDFHRPQDMGVLMLE